MRALLILFVAIATALLVLRTIQSFGDDIPVIETTSPERVSGNLTLQSIRFARTDFYVWPTRVSAELGRLRVAARRNGASQADGASMSLRFILFPSVAQHYSPAPIVYLAGGPGGSGVSSASGDRFPLFMKLREAGDVIAFDQRGTRYAEPYPECPEPVVPPLGRVLSSRDMLAVYAPVLRACFAHWTPTIHPDAFTTMESVHDLESLRVALGVERLSFVGISYGTHLALAYIRQYPEHVEKAVLAGVEGVDHTWKRPAIVDGVVREISATLAAEAGWMGFTDDIERALKRLQDDTPVVTLEDPQTGESVNVAIGPQDLKLAVFYGLSEREDFLDAAKRVRRIANGDDEMLARYAQRIRGPGNLSVMPLSMDCASGVSEERRILIEAERAGALIGDVANLSLEVTCPAWPVVDLGPQYRAPIAATVPVLAISGTLDTRTPPSNAADALAGFTQMRDLLIVGGGHNDDLLIASPQIGQAMVDFLTTGDPNRDRIGMPAL